MSLLATDQRDFMLLQGANLKEEIKLFDKAPMASNMGMFTMHPDEPRAGCLVLQEVSTLVEYCEDYRMGHIHTEGKLSKRHLDTVADNVLRCTGQPFRRRDG